MTSYLLFLLSYTIYPASKEKYHHVVDMSPFLLADDHFQALVAHRNFQSTTFPATNRWKSQNPSRICKCSGTIKTLRQRHSPCFKAFSFFLINSASSFLGD